MQREIHYIHLRSGCCQFRATTVVCRGENLSTNIDRYIDRDRITMNNSCLAARAKHTCQCPVWAWRHRSRRPVCDQSLFESAPSCNTNTPLCSSYDTETRSDPAIYTALSVWRKLQNWFTNSRIFVITSQRTAEISEVHTWPDFGEISSNGYKDIALTWLSGSLPAVTLTIDLLVRKSNQHIYAPKYTCDQNSVKFPLLVIEICCSQGFWVLACCDLDLWPQKLISTSINWVASSFSAMTFRI